MPTYKDENAKGPKKWYCLFYYKDHDGNQHRKCKRGFTLERDAKQWEREFLLQLADSPNMSFKSLTKLYIEDVTARAKPSTVLNICTTAKKFARFNQKNISSITPAEIRRWQNDIKQEYAPTTQRKVNTILNSIFKFACKFYGLKKNPVQVAGSIGNAKPERDMQVWTVEQFNIFIDTLESQYTSNGNARHDATYYVALFKTLFYTGMRVGELLALTIGDYDSTAATLRIKATMSRKPGIGFIPTAPKTKKSKRTITLPAKLVAALDEHIKSLQDKDPAGRLFPLTSEDSIYDRLAVCIALAGLPKIRIHDLRHSHASMLINANVNILAISERLGHENIQTTLNIYSHIYNKTNENIAKTINELI